CCDGKVLRGGGRVWGGLGEVGAVFAPAMLVLAAVPDGQVHKLRRAAGLRFHLAHARTWDDALTTIRTRPVELAVVDPLLGGTASATEISRLRLLFPSLPLALHPTLSPAIAGVLLAL